MSEQRKQTPKTRGLSMRDIEARIHVRNIGKDNTIGPGHYRWKPKMNDKRRAQWRANSQAKKGKWQ